MVALCIIGGIALLIFLLLALPIVKIEANLEEDLDYKVKYAGITVLAEPETKWLKKLDQWKHKRKLKKKKRKLKKLQKQKLKQAKAQKKLAQKKKQQKPSKTAVTAEDKTTAQTPPKPQPAKKEPQLTPQQIQAQEQIDRLKKILETGEIDESTVVETLKTLKYSVPHLKKLLNSIRIYDVYIDFVIGGEDAAKVAINYGLANAFVCTILGWLGSFTKLKLREVNIEADFRKQEGDYFAHLKARLCLFAYLRYSVGAALEQQKALFSQMGAEEIIRQTAGSKINK